MNKQRDGNRLRMLDNQSCRFLMEINRMEGEMVLFFHVLVECLKALRRPEECDMRGLGEYKLEIASQDRMAS